MKSTLWQESTRVSFQVKQKIKFKLILFRAEKKNEFIEKLNILLYKEFGWEIIVEKMGVVE